MQFQALRICRRISNTLSMTNPWLNSCIQPSPQSNASHVRVPIRQLPQQPRSACRVFIAWVHARCQESLWFRLRRYKTGSQISQLHRLARCVRPMRELPGGRYRHPTRNARVSRLPMCDSQQRAARSPCVGGYSMCAESGPWCTGHQQQEQHVDGDACAPCHPTASAHHAAPRTPAPCASLPR